MLNDVPTDQSPAIAHAVSSAIAASPPLYGLVADQTGSYRSIWLVLAAVLAVALVPAALVHERHEHVTGVDVVV